jgi:tetratricopeptide (TPR) repeat protein
MAKKDSLRCLAVRNPFAWAICAGEDTVENRSWPTDHRGTIAILASTNKTGANGLTKGGVIPADLFTFGAIIGLADIEDVIEYGPRVETSPWAVGPFCWLMTNPRFLERPVPLKGKLNLFYLADDVAKQVLSQPTHRLDLNDPQIQAYCEAMRPTLEPEQNYLAAAEEYWLEGNLSAGHRAVDACLRLAPELGLAHFLKGMLTRENGDDDAALGHFGTAIGYEPEMAPPYFQRGEIYFSRGELVEAWNEYQLAMRYAPAWEAPHIAQGVVSIARGEFAEAVEACTTAIELEPASSPGHYRRAEAQLKLGELDRAIDDATQALEHDPHLFEALLIRSQAYEAKGDTAQAKRDREAAKRIEAEQPIDKIAAKDAQSADA